jgi:hypothetical protein
MTKLLFHPKVTLAAVQAVFVSLGASCTSFVAALAPFLKLDFLKPWFPALIRIDGDLLAAGLMFAGIAALLGALAGAGRSFVSAVDAGPSKGN